MAMQEVNPASTPTAEVVGNAFVAQYYHILQQTPDLVHKFYQESSFLTRLESNHLVTTVTTVEGINEKIMSLNYNADITEIKTADAQDSYENGIIVFVTGCLTGKDGMRKKFTQTFFLAPQDNGYYVLNDIFRFMEEKNTLHVDDVLQNAMSYETTELKTEAEVCDPLETEEENSVFKEEDVNRTAHVTLNEAVFGDDSAPGALGGGHRKSYAEIVKFMKSIAVSSPGHASARNVNVPSAKSSQQVPIAAKVSPPEASGPSAESASGNINVQEEVEGFSIYVGNLPFDVTIEQLEGVFKKFGPVKHDGIRVRSNKPQGYCYGFVEFEELSSMQSAIEASPIKIGDRQSVIEEKRTTKQGSGNARGRYPSGRGGFRNENYRGRGKFSGGRGYGRTEFKNKEYSG